MDRNVAVLIDAGELITKLLDTFGWVVQSIAWPAASVILILLMRREIRGLFKRLTRGSWGNAEFHFAERLNEIAIQRDTSESGFPSAIETTEPEPAASNPAEHAPASDHSAEEEAPESPVASRPRNTTEDDRTSPSPVAFKRPSTTSKTSDVWITPLRLDDLATLATVSPSAAIQRAWRLLEKELKHLAPNHFVATLGLIPPEAIEGLTAEEASRLVNLKSLAADLDSGDVHPGVESAVSYVRLAEELRRSLKSRRVRNSKHDAT